MMSIGIRKMGGTMTVIATNVIVGVVGNIIVIVGRTDRIIFRQETTGRTFILALVGIMVDTDT